MINSLQQLRDRDMMDCAGMKCTYCRDADSECRPVAIEGRVFVPALCNDCFEQLLMAGRIDHDREKELFYT